jgi:hypothetical protein
VVEKLLAEPMLLALPRDHRGAAAAAQNAAARLRLALFDGRDYKVTYGMPPPGSPGFGADVRADDVIVLRIECSDPADFARAYQEKAALVYARATTLGRLPGSRAALAAPERAAGAGNRQGRP